MYHVFISYAGPPPLAKQIAKALKEKRIDVFWDRASLQAGDALCSWIRDSLQKCDEVCLLWTKDASESLWVRFECAVAFAYGKLVVPLVDGSNTAPLPEQFAHPVTQDLGLWFDGYVEEAVRRASKEPRTQNPSAILGPKNAPYQIISHCDHGKWTGNGFPQAPGYLLRGYLSPGLSMDTVKLVELQIGSEQPKNVKKRGQDAKKQEQDARKRIDPQANSLWLLDSPASNKLVKELIDSYRQWTAGGCLHWIDRSLGGQNETILIKSGRGQELPLCSEKLGPSDSNIGGIAPYGDYFVIMSLPGSTLGLVSRRARVWILFGLHQKGTFVATELFRGENLPRLMKDISKRCGSDDLSMFAGDIGDRDRQDEELPHFEAVYRVPPDVDVNQVMVDRLQLIHFAKLRSRSEDATADEPEWQILPSFRSKEGRGQIPIQIAHLDLVSGCNFKCPQCIEAEMRGTRLKLALDTCVRILSDLRWRGCKKLGFYGGEPTLHGHFGLILDMAGHMGFNSTLVTNGSRLDQPEVRGAILRNRKDLQLRVSLDANSEATHMKVHGRPGAEYPLDGIAAATEHLIGEGVHTSISYLLVPGSGNIEELSYACSRWRRAGARQIALRLTTKPHGKAPATLSAGELNLVGSALKDNRDFISAPTWLRDLVDSHPAAHHNRARECYSSYYRVVVSPWLREGSKRPSPEDRYGLAETHEAWLSLCAYHRLDPRCGLPWPADLGVWLRNYRQATISSIDPGMCQDVKCCRQAYNQQVDDYLHWSLGENP